MSHTIDGARIGRKTTFTTVNPDILEDFVAGSSSGDPRTRLGRDHRQVAQSEVKEEACVS